MAEKRIFDIQTEATIDDITQKVYMWLDKKANEGEPNEPSWKFKADVFLKILNNFATKFVPNVLTVEGKCYWHNGELYKCNVAYTGAWVPGNFTATSIDALFARKDVLSALQEALETTNGNVTALTTYAQNVAHSIAPEFDPTRDFEHAYPVGEYVTHQGDFYRFKNPHYGPWSNSDVTKTSAGEVLAQCLRMMGSASSLSITDANAAPIGSLIWCQPTNEYSNFPVNTETGNFYSGNLFTLAMSYTQTSEYITQLYFTTQSTIYTRFRVYGGNWSAWSRISDETDISAINSAMSTMEGNISNCLAMKGTNTSLSLTDADNAPVGAVVWCDPPATSSHFPIDPDTGNFAAGNLLSFARSSTFTSQYITQLYFTTKAKIYTRFKKYGGSWTSWDLLATQSGITSLITSISAINASLAKCVVAGGTPNTQSFTDADNATVNTIVWCNMSEITNPQHFPTSPASGNQYSGTLVTLCRTETTNSYSMQLYCTTQGFLFVRFKAYGGWTSWSQVAFKSDIPENVDYLPDLAMFPRVGVVGDSFASALLYDENDTSMGTFYDLSWPQILGRNTGSTWINFTRGGLSTRTWLTSEYGLSKMLSEDPCDLYVLVLGINDRAIADYLGSLTDITSHASYTEYPDTFYGNYGKIVEQILAHAPSAKMIFSTMAANGELSSPYNAAIEEIAAHYEVPVIYQYNEPFFSQPIYSNMYGSHPTKAGQAGMANAIGRMIQKCVFNNLTYFNSFEGLT